MSERANIGSVHLIYMSVFEAEGWSKDAYWRLDQYKDREQSRDGYIMM